MTHVLLAAFDPFLSGYDEARGREFYRQLVERVRALPGVQSATLARRLPLTLSNIAFANVTIDGYAPAPDEDMRLNYETVGPQYFQTMRIPVVRGRDFDERDGENAHRVVIINEAMARRYWPNGGALGQRIKLTSDWLEIVGVAKNVKNRSLNFSGLATSRQLESHNATALLPIDPIPTTEITEHLQSRDPQKRRNRSVKVSFQPLSPLMNSRRFVRGR